MTDDTTAELDDDHDDELPTELANVKPMTEPPTDHVDTPDVGVEP